MPSKTGLASAGLPPLLDNALVLCVELEPVNLVAPQKISVSGIGDFYLAEHLAHDDFNVFVIDFDALQPINFLHLIEQVFLKLLRPADVEHFVRHDRTR